MLEQTKLEAVKQRVLKALDACNLKKVSINGVEVTIQTAQYNFDPTHVNFKDMLELNHAVKQFCDDKMTETEMREAIRRFRNASETALLDFTMRYKEPCADRYKLMQLLFDITGNERIVPIIDDTKVYAENLLKKFAKVFDSYRLQIQYKNKEGKTLIHSASIAYVQKQFEQYFLSAPKNSVKPEKELRDLFNLSQNTDFGNADYVLKKDLTRLSCDDAVLIKDRSTTREEKELDAIREATTLDVAPAMQMTPEASMSEYEMPMPWETRAEVLANEFTPYTANVDLPELPVIADKDENLIGATVGVTLKTSAVVTHTHYCESCDNFFSCEEDCDADLKIKECADCSPADVQSVAPVAETQSDDKKQAEIDAVRKSIKADVDANPVMRLFLDEAGRRSLKISDYDRFIQFLQNTAKRAEDAGDLEYAIWCNSTRDLAVREMNILVANNLPTGLQETVKPLTQTPAVNTAFDVAKNALDKMETDALALAPLLMQETENVHVSATASLEARRQAMSELSVAEVEQLSICQKPAQQQTTIADEHEHYCNSCDSAYSCLEKCERDANGAPVKIIRDCPTGCKADLRLSCDCGRGDGTLDGHEDTCNVLGGDFEKEIDLYETAKATKIYIGEKLESQQLEKLEITEDEKALADAVEDDGSEQFPDEVDEPVQANLFGDISAPKVVRQKMFTPELMIQTAFDWHREQGFPYRDVPPAMAMLELQQLAETEGKALIKTHLGYHVADTFHKHRLHGHARNMRSPFDSFNDDDQLRRALKLEMRFGGKPRVFAGGMLTMVKGTQACSNFRPGFACYLYREYCPDNATVLDTSTGYGGRLLGAVASQKVSKYIGIDPNVPTYEANIKMIETLKLRQLLEFELYNLPAEDVDVESLRERCDFSFTSPPYFTKEIYSQDDTQSWVRYKTGEMWRDNFLAKMVALTYASLKVNSHAIINIADVNIGSKKYPLVEWTKQLGTEAGLAFLRTDQFPMSTRFGQNMSAEVAFEPVLIFKKEK